MCYIQKVNPQMKRHPCSASLSLALPRSLCLALPRSASLALPRSASLALAQAARPARVSQAGFAAGENEGQDEDTAIAIAEGTDLDPKLTLELVDCVLLFESFPEKSHTGLNIENWLLNGLKEAGLEKADIALTVPDGAANGLRALRAMGLPYEICDPHQLQVGQPACAPAACPRTHAHTRTRARDRETARPRDRETARPRDRETARLRDCETVRVHD